MPPVKICTLTPIFLLPSLSSISWYCLIGRITETGFPFFVTISGSASEAFITGRTYMTCTPLTQARVVRLPCTLD